MITRLTSIWTMWLVDIVNQSGSLTYLGQDLSDYRFLSHSFRTNLNNIYPHQQWFRHCTWISSSAIQLSATGRLLDITYMCYEYRTPLFPAQLLQARQSDLSVTSIPQSVNRWRHNEYSWCSHPLHFVQASYTPVVKVRLVVWRSDLTGQGDGYKHIYNNKNRSTVVLEIKMTQYKISAQVQKLDS